QAGKKINSIKVEPIKRINDKNKEVDNLVIKQIVKGEINALPNGFQKASENEAEKLLDSLKRTLKARQKLEEAIEATPKAKTSGLIEELEGRSGEIKLEDITEVLQKLQEPNLSDEEKTTINGATDRENLKDIQREIRAKRSESPWEKFFQKREIKEESDKKIWQGAYSTLKGYEEAENYLSKVLEKDADNNEIFFAAHKIENEEQKNNWKIVAGSKVEKAKKIWSNDKYHQKDINKISEILKEISITNNLTDFRKIDLDNLGYDENFVPADYGHNKIK
ncbi:5963_t:CDS:2, partial [Funneliformis geosporum]